MNKGTTKVILILVLICIIGLIAFHTYANQDLTKAQVNPVQLPKSFEPVQWAKDGWIYGTMGTKFIRYNPETGSKKMLLPHVWSGLSDSQGRHVAFINEKGLQYVDLIDGNGIQLIDSKSDLQIHLWSPDSKQFLYSRVDERSLEYFIYDLDKGERRSYPFKNVENFLSKPIYWRDGTTQDQLLFSLRFSRSRTGEQEYRSGGYRSELYLANDTGEFTPLVEVKDGEYILVDEISSNGEKVYFHFFGKAGEIYECDLSIGESHLVWSFDQIKNVVLAPEINLGFIEKDHLELIDLNQDEIIHTFSFEYKRVIWSYDHRQALVYPSRESAVTTGYLVQLQQ